MPQGDFATFPSTVLAVALSFIGGYLFFVGWWVPRVLLTFKARHWLSQHVQSTTLKAFQIGKKQASLTVDVQRFTQSGLPIFVWGIFGKKEQDESVFLDIFLNCSGWINSQVGSSNGRNYRELYQEVWPTRRFRVDWFESYWPIFPKQGLTGLEAWSETFLLCLLFVTLTPSQLDLPSTEWVYPIASLLSIWVVRRNDVLSRVYSQINNITAFLAQSMFSNLPAISMAQVHQRLKIAQSSLFSNSNVRSLE